ncbi:MAG TPA: phosphoribosylformylglycinamidine synthase subunit PurQ [Firmicutes bacterium]|nr:phosphoribosylformylglycinamidine synthase subunit PurQ [Bacillota bacterium]
MKSGVVIFPGSNCDRDTVNAMTSVTGTKAVSIWHKETKLPKLDCIILPGGFSYGDYLRAGAIARFSPVLQAVSAFAKKGGLVIGICNGFQILTEAGLLPGALMVNRHLQFISKLINIKVENNKTVFTNKFRKGQVLQMPIAHYEGNYYAAPEILERLKKENRIIFRYCNKDGECTEKSNPNGALFNIAGIINENGNVLGMMPHFERAYEKILCSEDGKYLILSIMENFNDR